MDHDYATVWKKDSNQVHDSIMMLDNSMQNSRTLLGRDAVRLPYCMYSIDGKSNQFEVTGTLFDSKVTVVQLQR